MNDLELLAEYSRSRSQEAFAALVGRYIRLVHSACWRQMGDAQLAEDATQMVFVLLSRKAGKLRRGELAGWLLTTAHYTCANMKRAESRRVRREQAVAMNPVETSSEPNRELLQLLDEGLLHLRAEDREALVARFLREEPLRQVGEGLGLSEDAARKRVDRGLDKLRQFFQDRGVATDSAALAAILADHTRVPPISGNLTPRILQAARLQPGWASPALRLKVALSLSVVMAAALGAAGWGILKLASRASVADPVAAAATAPVDPAPQAPSLPVADVPLPDRSTPDKALASLCRAMHAADGRAAEACLLININQATTPLGASWEISLSHRRLTMAAEKAYGPDAHKLLSGEVPIENVLQAMIVLRQLQGDTATINGDAATISVQIPPAMLQNLPAGLQKILLGWSGKCLYFKLQDGAWRTDVSRSLRFLMRVQKQPGGPLVRASDGMIVAMLQDEVKGCDVMTAQIAAGELATLSDAQAAMHSMLDVLGQKYGICGTQSYIAPRDAPAQ